jgi:hypothetical protein
MTPKLLKTFFATLQKDGEAVLKTKKWTRGRKGEEERMRDVLWIRATFVE